MSFLLDTNILSAHLRRPSGLAHYFSVFGSPGCRNLVSVSKSGVSSSFSPGCRNLVSVHHSRPER